MAPRLGLELGIRECGSDNDPPIGVSGALKEHQMKPVIPSEAEVYQKQVGCGFLRKACPFFKAGGADRIVAGILQQLAESHKRGRRIFNDQDSSHQSDAPFDTPNTPFRGW
jgi:hypothetical protein